MNRRIAKKIRKQWDHWHSVVNYHHTVQWNLTIGPHVLGALGSMRTAVGVLAPAPLTLKGPVVPKPYKRSLPRVLVAKAYNALAPKGQLAWYADMVLAQATLNSLRNPTLPLDNHEQFMGGLIHFMNALNEEYDLAETVNHLTERGG